MGFLLNIILTLICANIFEIFVSVSSSTPEQIPKDSVHISQGYFTKNIPVHDFVYPLKVSGEGKEKSSHLVTNYYTHDNTQPRKKREIEKEKLRYDLPLSNGKVLKLILTPNYDIATPSLAVEHKNLETEFNIGKTRIRRASKKKCYYSGKVVNDPNSDVAISTCRGLAGYIRSSDGDYFIEPSSAYDPVDGAVHPHIIFKKAHRKKNPDDASSLVCGNKLNEYKRREDEFSKDNCDDELQERSMTHKDVATRLVSLDDEDTSSDENNGSKSNDENDNSNSDEETEELENIDDSEQHVLATKKTIIKQKANKKLKSKLQKYNDNLDEIYKDSDNIFNLNITTEQCLEIKEDFSKKYDFDNKLHNNKQFLSKGKKLSFEVFDTNTETEDSNFQTIDTDNDKFDKNNNGNNVSNEYDYEQDANSLKKNSKNIKNAELMSFDSNKSNLQIDKLFHDHVHERIDEATRNDAGIRRIGKCRKKKIESNNCTKTPSKKPSKQLHRKHKHNKSKVIEVSTNDVANGLFDNINKMKNDGASDDKRLFFNKAFSSKNLLPSSSNENKYKSDYKKRSHLGKTKLQKKLMDDEKLNFNSLPHDTSYLFNNKTIEDSFNSSLRIDSSNQYKGDNIKVNIKRNIEYKSCKLPSNCQNKTECTWDLRLLMVISYLFSQRHKDIDLETFVLTIVNMINRNFQDSSLGVIVNIKLVRMVFIEYKMEELDEDKNKYEDLFENFCLFQYRINPFRSDHPNHHDIAVYLISTNLCNINVMYGLSNQASLCDCQKSCIVSVDEGLLLGNIITHQLGHSLGAEHVIKGSEPFCDPSGRKVYYHMEQLITLNATQWSKCSSYAIRKFIRTQGVRCLKHTTVELDFDWALNMLPGQIYNPVQQCSLNFHMPLLPCYNGDFCKNLYCQINDKQCISNLVAPADGTACASQMWCVRGYCVTEGRYPEMVNGEWNVWGPWSPCSRSCGGGIQQANRLCNNPPPSRGGRYCIGKRIRYRVCSIDRCDQHSIAFREQQCRRTEENPFRGQYYSWKVFYNNFEYVECSLLCESETGIIAVRRLIVEDGTSCKPGTKNVCIAGKCIDIGCDWGINSGAVVDACGICHGNGTECKIIQGLYTESNKSGVIPFMKVPRGSGMIYARELNPSDLTFVVSSFNSGKFYINGFKIEEKRPKTGDVDFGNTRGLYSVLGGMERLFIPGPTDEDLVFFAKFSKDKNPGIRYQFAMPDVDPNYVPIYSWQFIDWETCSDACGGGQQKALPKCVEDQGGIVEDIYCLELTRPENIVRSCNEFPCLPKWWVGSWSECITIGNEEVRYRSVLCMRTRDPNSLRNEILKEKYCCDEEKPDSVRRCNETYAKCQEKAERCDLYENFPSVINLNDLNVRFASIEPDSEESENKNLDNLKNLLLDNVNSSVGTSAQQEKDKINKAEELDRYVYDYEDETPQPLINSQSNLIEIVKRKSLPVVPKPENKFNLVKEYGQGHNFAKLFEDVISPENVSALAALKESQKKVPLKKLHDEEYNRKSMNSTLNSTIGGNIKIAKFGKIEGSPVGTNLITNVRNAKVGSTIQGPLNNLIRVNSGSEVPTTCKVMFTCKTENKDFCNATERELPFKCPSPSQPLKTILDQIVLNEYKLAIIPIVCEKHLYRPGDHDYESFLDTTVWSVGLETKKTMLYGKEALNFLLNVRKNLSQIPFVYQAEN